MWILDFLPDIVFHLILSIGIIGLIVGFVFGFIPIVDRYKLPIQVISIFLFAVGLWYEGGIAKNKQWADRAMQLESDLAVARSKSEKTNTEIIIKVLNNKQKTKDNFRTVTEYIDREVVKNDPSCPINSAVIKSHNAAATNNLDILTDNTVVSTTEHNDLAKSKIKLAPKK
jgi:hypothetical protein